MNRFETALVHCGVDPLEWCVYQLDVDRDEILLKLIERASPDDRYLYPGLQWTILGKYGVFKSFSRITVYVR